MPDKKPSLRERIKGWLRTDGISDADLDAITDDLMDEIGDGDDAAGRSRSGRWRRHGGPAR